MTEAAVKKKKIYVGELCGKSRAKKENLKLHIQDHNGEKPCKCNKCDKTFTLDKNLNCDVSSRIGNKPFKCNQCSNSYKTKKTLGVHKCKLLKRLYQCNLCDRSFIAKRLLDKHICLFKCKHCSKSFRNKNKFNIHTKRLHTKEKKFKCDECDKSFLSVKILNQHMRGPCGLKAAGRREDNLVQSQLAAEPATSLDFVDCGLTIKEEREEEVEILVDEDPFGQTVQPRIVQVKSLYNPSMHICTQRTYNHKDVMSPWGCDVCRRRFQSSQSLVRHMFGHSGRPPLKCRMCRQLFSTMESLKVHTQFIASSSDC